MVTGHVTHLLAATQEGEGSAGVPECSGRLAAQIKRTEGVSSTDLVGRMLMCTRDNSRAVQEQVLAHSVVLSCLLPCLTRPAWSALLPAVRSLPAAGCGCPCTVCYDSQLGIEAL